MATTTARGHGARTQPTSPAQFNLLIQYMERHGDLCHPTSTATTNGRIQTIKSWERLVECLNADSMDGEPRDLPRWKKVWSDLKNHTKKKAARLMAGGAGGTTRLTDTELRVLHVLGMIKKKPPGSILKTLTPLQAAGGEGARAGSPTPPRVLTAISPASPPPHENDLYEITFDELVTRKRRQRHVPPLQVTVDDCGGDDFTWPEDLEGVEAWEGAEYTLPSPLAEDLAGPPALPRPDRSGFTSTRRSGVAGMRRGGGRGLRRALAALVREMARTRQATAVREARLLRALTDWQRLCHRGLGLVRTFLRQQRSGDTPPPHLPLVLHPEHGAYRARSPPAAAPPAHHEHETTAEPDLYSM